MQETDTLYESAAGDAIELGNQLADANPDEDVWDIADGLLAGAVQYWFYSREPCGDPACEECAPISTAEARLELLKQMVDELSRTSDYFHTPNDANAGRA